MKILKIIASGFKNCVDNFEISYVPIARKTDVDKEYELEEVAEGLYVFSTIGVVGKNASGKTSVLDLLNVCYEILGNFRITKKNYSLESVYLSIFFYHEGYIYRYNTLLKEDAITDKVYFENQKILRKEYFKSNVKNIFEFDKCEKMEEDGKLPEDTSNVFFIFKKIGIPPMYYTSLDLSTNAYKTAFVVQRAFNLPENTIKKILKIFDENITKLEMIDENNYLLEYNGKEEKLSDFELYYRLSSGTTKGLALYTTVILSLRNGFDLMIDEIENHFHKTLVENIISLYRDKTINKKNATLIFATHYCEILDLFNRQDNIYITKTDEKVKIFNMYKDFDVRPELLKSKQFYNNVFKTAVNYDALMDLKKELKQK